MGEDEPDPLAGLNEDQRRAVTWTGGPLLVLAGPGSGKTRVITHRIAHRILAGGAEARRILAITFTNRAAHEMKTRVDGLLGHSGNVRIGTFHWMCHALLRRHVDRLGRRRDFRLLAPHDSRRILRATLADSGANLPFARVAAAVSALKNAMPLAQAAKLHGLAPETLSAIAERYDKQLAMQGALDLDDLQHRAAELLRGDDALRHWCRESVAELLVDEYQDTNPVQHELIALLRPTSGALFAVGDQDQSIYGWRQASAGDVKKFRERYPGAEIMVLGETYRSTKHIFRAAQELIGHNRDRVARQLRTVRGAGTLPVVYAAGDAADEAEWIATEINRLVRSREAHARDIGVLFRVNAQSRAIEDALIHAGIPYHVLGGRRFYDRPEVQAAVALLRLTLDPADDEAAALLLARVPGIGTIRLESLRARAESVDRPLLASLVDAGPSLPESARRRVSSLRSGAHLVARLRARRVSEVVDAAIRVVASEEAGGMEPITENDQENLEELRNVVGELESSRASLATIVDRFALGIGQEHAGQGVSLLTLHAAKGLEFDTVFVAGVEDGLLPHRRSTELDGGEQEERRLLYVGVTRARNRLYLSYAHCRRAAGQAIGGGPSPFLAEMGVSNVSLVSSPELQVRPRLTVVAPGERVRHARWKTGIVTRIEGAGRETMVTIEFEEAGRRRLQLCDAPLTRIPGDAGVHSG